MVKKASISKTWHSSSDTSKTVLVGISMRNPAFEGERMARIVRMLHESYDILLADHLDRHNIARDTGLSPEHPIVHGLCDEQSAAWMARNGKLLVPGYTYETVDGRGNKILHVTKSGPRVVRWRDVFETSANDERRAIVDNRLNGDVRFRAQYEDAIDAFAVKTLKLCARVPTDDEMAAIRHASGSYILEELAVAGAFAHVDYNAYPGGLFPVASSACAMWVERDGGDATRKLLVRDIQFK